MPDRYGLVSSSSTRGAGTSELVHLQAGAGCDISEKLTEDWTNYGSLCLATRPAADFERETAPDVTAQEVKFRLGRTVEAGFSSQKPRGS